MHDVVPHIERIDGNDVWMAGGERLGAPGYYSMAGFDGVMPVSIPKTYDEIARRDVRRRRRASRSSTREGIDAQVLYPNVGGFGNGYFLRLGDPSSSPSACAPTTTSSPTGAAPTPSACSRSPRSRSGTSTSPIGELQRCIELGHRAVNFCNQPQDYGQPPLAHPHWDPIWAAAQEAGISVSFHVGGGSMGTQFGDERRHGLDDELRQGLVADLHGQHALHRRPDLRRRVPPLPRPEAGVGRVGRRLDPGRDGDLRLAVAQRWRARRAPRVRPAAERVLPAADLRLLLVRAAGRARRHRAVPRQHPVRDRLPAPDVPAPGAAHARPAPARLRAASCSADCPTTSCARCCTTTRPRSTASSERTCQRSTLPTSGASTSSRTSTVACCTCASTGSSGATRSPRTCTAASSAPRSGPTANPSSTRCASPAPTTGSVPVATGRLRRRPRGARGRVGRHRPLPVPSHRALPQAVGREDQRRCASPAVSISRCTAT